MTLENKLIQGLGNDIIEIERIEKIILRYGEKFLKKIFTLAEINYCSKHAHHFRHFAGRFAAKEAISKSLGCGIGRDIGWLEIEILNDERGKPVVELSKAAKKKFNSPQISISISHCKSYACAVAIAISKQRKRNLISYIK